MFIFISLLITCILTVVLYFREPKFGKLPSGKVLERIKLSPNFTIGQFQNLEFTPNLTEGASLIRVMQKFFFEKSKFNKPPSPLPSKKTDLLNLDPTKNMLVWFGHSSYFMQIDGKKILVDPVFSGAASPFSFTTKSFAGSDVYTAADFPEIDYLFITHDHWDHLDFKTIVKLRSKVNQIITGLGVAPHLRFWGYDAGKIIELDWNDEISLQNGFHVWAVASRHFSGRLFKRNRSLWNAYVLQTPTLKILIGGDSGYGAHFEVIGKRFGPFDLAILECGQYNLYWKHIHAMPEEVVQAAIDLKAKHILPVHWAKFSLSLHDWDEPIKRVMAEAERRNVSVIHPMIGEEVDFRNLKTYSRWWEHVGE
jgi:L-ascorbate metabolism protein UlaG (beta-lactamase superfamily)